MTGELPHFISNASATTLILVWVCGGAISGVVYQLLDSFITGTDGTGREKILRIKHLFWGVIVGAIGGYITIIVAFIQLFFISLCLLLGTISMWYENNNSKLKNKLISFFNKRI